MNRFVRLAPVAIALCLLAGPVLAQDKAWEIRLTPYLWGVSLEGTAAIGPAPPTDIDASFSDILSNANMALSLHTEFIRDKWTFTIDPTYMSLTIDVDVPVPPVSGEIDIDMWFVELWAAYEFVDHWQILGGARWQSQEISPDFGLGLASGVDVDWTDWFVGFRYTNYISEKWFVAVRGDVQFAGDSDSRWNATVFFSRRFGQRDNMALNLGYRYYTDDFETGSGLSFYAWDMDMTGPVVGYTWRFGAL